MRRFSSSAIVLALLLSTVVAWALYWPFGHTLISQAYNKQSFDFVNRLISNRTGDPLSYYLHRGDSLMIRATLLLLAGVFLIVLAEQLWRRKLFASTLFSICIVVASYEASMLLFLKNPQMVELLPARLSQHVRKAYISRYRDVVHASPGKYRYDPELTYTLAPGEYHFSGSEFKVHYKVNSLGLRDDRSSLDKPTVVVLGDSHAMGWAVEQDEIFSELLEQELAVKVLNAGIASYGTVRALKLLERIDTSQVDLVILQHCDNDAKENLQYLKNGKLPTTPEEMYQEYVTDYQARRSYYPIKFLFFFLNEAIVSLSTELERTIFKSGGSESSLAQTSEQQAEAFLRVLAELTPRRLLNTQFVVISMNGYASSDKSFIDAVNHMKSSPKYPQLVQSLHTVDLSTVAQASHRYHLDDHINAVGHRAIAEKLITELKGFL